jgi:CubicO group peptidase (beta-lactamase class C family)
MKQGQYKVIFIILLSITFLPSCHIARFFYYNVADVNDFRKFPQYEIKKGESSFEFINTEKNIDVPLPSHLKETNSETFSQFIESHKTLSFIIIRNDSILYENYFDGYDDASVLPSFSASKVFISALMGISIDKGKIKSVNDSVTTYLPMLRGKGLESITIEHLLDMRSGIDFDEGYRTPFSEMAKYYYGLDLKKYIGDLRLKQAPGLSYDYVSVNSQLIAMAIENAWGKSFPEIVEEEIWQPLGMEFDATWNLDSKKHETVKAFCCLNARARDFAKLGRLYLQLGNWEGKQLLSRDWVRKSLKIHNDSHDSQGFSYSYQWRVLESGAYFAKGILGQFIYVYPSKHIIIVRMGRSTDNIHWPDFFQELCKEL